MSEQWFILLFSGLTAVAAVGSAWAAYFGPLRAASATIELQHKEAADTAKKKIFETIMANRRSLWVKQAADALNLIDVIWYDKSDIRDAWAELYRALNGKPRTSRTKLPTSFFG